MNPLLTRTLSLFCALLLVLPAGLCCVETGPQEASAHKSAAACPACAERGGPKQHDSRPPAPSPDGCCCELHPAVAAKAETKLPDLGAVLAASIAPTGVQPAIARDRAVPRSPVVRGGPRVHVLQCVWRC